MPDREFSIKKNYCRKKPRSFTLTNEQLRSARYLNRARATHIKLHEDGIKTPCNSLNYYTVLWQIEPTLAKEMSTEKKILTKKRNFNKNTRLKNSFFFKFSMKIKWLLCNSCVNPNKNKGEKY